jgi:hypothetical protein
MPFMQHGRQYFGRLLVKSGTTGNPVQIRKIMQGAGWDMPDGKLSSGAQGSWFYGVGARWGKNVVPCPDGRPAECQYSGYPACLIPWPGRVRGCPEEPNAPDPNMAGIQFAPIPGTITLEVRTDSKNEPYQAFPPPADDPWWEHRTFGARRDGYDRTAWFSAIWAGPTGEATLAYSDNTLETWTEDFSVFDMWDDSGVQVLGMPPPAWRPPRVEFERVEPIYERVDKIPGLLQRSPGVKAKPESKFPWGWVLGLSAAVGVGLYVYKAGSEE